MKRFPQLLCLFHPGAFGDGILALKTVHVLKKQFPDHLVVWFGHKELGEVLVACQEVHQAYSFDDIHFLTSGKSVHVEGIISNLFKRCDRAVGWMDDSDGTWKRHFFEVGIETVMIRSPHDLRLKAHHMADRYLEILEPWLVGENGCSQREDDFSEEAPLAFPGIGKSDTFDSSQGPLIVLHPGSGSPYKCAPSRVLATLASGLMAEPGRRLCVVGGPADHESVRQLEAELSSIEITFLQEMDLLTMSRFIRQANLFIGHDSGLSHLAAGFGVPSLLFFGPTDPTQWAPQGAHVTVMRNVCQCEGDEAIKQCSDRSCLSFSVDDALSYAKSLFSGKQIPAFSGSSLNSEFITRKN